MMNNSIPKVKTAYVLLVNVDDRQTAMLRMAFKMYNSVNYKLIHPGDNIQPELILVDGDAEDGVATWQKTKDTYPEAIVVFFAYQEPSITVPYLKKPIKFDTVFHHLRNLQQGNGVWLAGRQTVDENINNKTETTKSTDISNHTDDGYQSVTIECFHPKPTLLGLVQNLSKQKDDTVILFNGKPVLIVFPNIAKVLLVVESAVLQRLCRRNDVQWRTRIVPSIAPTEKLHKKAKLTLKSCIWQLSIWTSHGRLIEPIKPNTIIKLKAWPNITRLAYLPEAIRLSAFLVRAPVPLNALYKLLPVSLEDVLNYIAAAYSIGALEIEQPLTNSVVQQEQEMILTREMSKSASVADRAETAEHTGDDADKPKGLLARLMGRLRGK